MRLCWSLLFLVCLACSALSCCAVAQEELPILIGFVTDAGTATRYSVDAQPVACVPGVTETMVTSGHGRVLHKDCPVRVFGEPIRVFGKKSKKLGAVEASRVETSTPAASAVEGFALIDRVLAPLENDLARYRADGYSLSVTPRTKVIFPDGGALTMATVGTNVWVRYAGTLRVNGMVEAASMEFSPNVVQRQEEQLRAKTEFDATAVTEDDRQSSLGRYLNGVKADRLPAYEDAAMQHRVETIGAALVPAYQRQLAASDPTKIPFRFQVVDDAKLRGVLTQPSGVVQVPYTVVARLQNDSQVAAVLSAAIATVMEKQELRAIPQIQKLQAASVAGLAAGFLVPGLGLATSIASARAAVVMEHHQTEHSTRTGLALMRDAGYDVREAPVAWWLVADAKGKELGRVGLPYATQYLYELLWVRGE